MNKIEELIQQLCPEGVQWKELGEVAEIGTGNKNGNEAIENGTYPFYVRSKFIKKINSYDFDEEAIIIPGEGGIGEIFHYINGKYSLHQRAYRIHFLEEGISTRFEYFYMMVKFKEFIFQKAVVATVSSIRKPMIEKFQIPIPPLPVQQEIVNILDTFTQLEAELEAELEARKKQYEYYRNELLTFGDELEWKTLGEVMTITRGASPRPISNFITNESDGVPWIKIGDVEPKSKFITTTKEKITKEGAKKSRFLRKGDFILSNSMSFGRPYILAIDGCIHDGWISMQHFENNLKPDFLYHLLRSNSIQNYWKQKASSGTVQNLNADIVRATEIPIPPLAEQERIAGILDHFDTLVNDITIGLPAEIEARRKQYEYYREKLLSFDRAE
ncbi:MAG: restriction endonuclease subunit S [Bacteroidales bacterium]|nr:restriction endonuclease subunit S [Bacteroidales bacterium]